MLDSERTFKIKVRLLVFKIFITSAIICIQRVFHGNEIVKYLQNYKCHKFDQFGQHDLLIPESSYRVLQVTTKWRTLKQPVYFLKAVVVCPIVDI